MPTWYKAGCSLQFNPWLTSGWLLAYFWELKWSFNLSATRFSNRSSLASAQEGDKTGSNIDFQTTEGSSPSSKASTNYVNNQRQSMNSSATNSRPVSQSLHKEYSEYATWKNQFQEQDLKPYNEIRGLSYIPWLIFVTKTGRPLDIHKIPQHDFIKVDNRFLLKSQRANGVHYCTSVSFENHQLLSYLNPTR